MFFGTLLFCLILIDNFTKGSLLAIDNAEDSVTIRKLVVLKEKIRAGKLCYSRFRVV